MSSPIGTVERLIPCPMGICPAEYRRPEKQIHSADGERDDVYDHRRREDVENPEIDVDGDKAELEEQQGIRQVQEGEGSSTRFGACSGVSERGYKPRKRREEPEQQGDLRPRRPLRKDVC